MDAEKVVEQYQELLKLQQENAALKEAVKAAIPCLEDWIVTTGFGTVNRRDREALMLLKSAIKE